MEREKAKKNRGTYIYWFIAIKKTSAMWNIVYTSSAHEIKRCIIDSSPRLSAACIAQAPDWNYASEKHSREDHHRWWNVRTLGAWSLHQQFVRQFSGEFLSFETKVS